MKVLRLIYVAFAMMCVMAASGKEYRWSYDLSFEAPVHGRVMYNTRDRLEMMWGDLTFIVQVYSNRGVDDDVLKENLRRKAAEYNMYDTGMKRYSNRKFKGYKLRGTLPDGSEVDICNVVSEKSGLCVQFVLNYVSTSRKAAAKLLESIEEKPEKKETPDEKPQSQPKQKIQKKGEPPKPIKKPTINPADLYEI